jgi:hypothetical protein
VVNRSPKVIETGQGVQSSSLIFSFTNRPIEKISKFFCGVAPQLLLS